MTSKIAKIKGLRIYEVGISYYGRTYEEGKKISWKDGVQALWCILKYSLKKTTYNICKWLRLLLHNFFLSLRALIFELGCFASSKVTNGFMIIQYILHFISQFRIDFWKSFG